MKKVKYLLIIVLLFSIFATSCEKINGKKDTTGRYKLSSDGEAIINDVTFSSDYKTSDNNRVMYQIFVGSFADSNGDGIGDIRGIINNLDYLNDGNPKSGESLGVEGLWLSPIFKSPSYHKYDAEDYLTIDPDFGSREDLWELIELCHQRNMIVILDFAINHTSTSSQSFIEFLKARNSDNTESKYYDYYTYLGPDESKPAGRTFQTFPAGKGYYECNFSTDMPELNYDNQVVRQDMLEVAKTYLDLGVDGFRFDAAKYIYYGETAKNVEFWSWYMGELKKIKPDIYAVAEVWDGDAIIKKYISAINCFDFAGSQSNGIIAETAKNGNVSRFTKYVEDYVTSIAALRSDAIYMPFVSNHDLDRAAGFLSVSSKQAYVAANLYILSPGSPFIYYGEEIGMKGSRGSANTDANRRLAMLWGNDNTIKNPSGSTYKTENQTNGTVADQLGAGDSLYSHYKRLIMIRNANPEIARGEYRALQNTSKEIGGFTSTLDGSSVCVVHNTSATEELSIDLSSATNLSFTKLVTIIGDGKAALEGNKLTVGPQTSVILR